jgi:hypothetical protein
MNDTIETGTELNNVKTFPGFENRRQGVSLFAGWSFMRFREGPIDCLTVMPIYHMNAPTFEYSPDVSLEHLENPMHAMFWVPLALATVCKQVLAEAWQDTAHRKGNLNGSGWDEFRAEVSRHCKMTMEEIIQYAIRDGFEEAAGYMTRAIYIESGLSTAIRQRQEGRPTLRSA